ncbi:hypothetical protein C41B8_16039 [Salinisphaera hydrothermalis C41B8]|uniref:ATP-grasp domain-containing protein n=2 Tax=Salinisphaera TaxID=180541 RepID=A0A084IHL1_SALHC|nr:hypothetical protein C41B8_16039 [Salinisphaera hydrothermalis C41B8]
MPRPRGSCGARSGVVSGFRFPDSAEVRCSMSSLSDTVSTQFLGLAPFLRRSIQGEDLQSLAEPWIERAQAEPDNAVMWMNLATLMLCLGQRDLGLTIQAQALAMQRHYRWPAARQPAALRVLLLTAPGDLAANMPLDCLLEDSDVDLEYYFVMPTDASEETPLPEHDLAIVAMSDSDANRASLEAMQPVVADWPRPVLNTPEAILNTERERASQLLQGVRGLNMPPTRPVTADTLATIAAGETDLAAIDPGIEFPVILRPRDSHGGHGLARLADREALAAYLDDSEHSDFLISPFIDYHDADGLYRKYRVVLVDGEPFASHMGISSDWMIHYLNAGMYEDADKRAGEAAWMASFDTFADQHHTALKAIDERAGLDYVCIDCAQTADGELLVFEIGNAMVVHAMDSADLFPHKQEHMAKVQTAFRELLEQRVQEDQAAIASESA